jgi:hypothetical protein
MAVPRRSTTTYSSAKPDSRQRTLGDTPGSAALKGCCDDEAHRTAQSNLIAVRKRSVK